MLKSEEAKTPSPQVIRADIELELAHLNQEMHREITEVRKQPKPTAQLNEEVLAVVVKWTKIGEPLREVLNRLA